MEKKIYFALGKAAAAGNRGTASPVVVFKGLNPLQRGQLLREKWERFDHPVAILLDATRYDGSIQTEHLLLEHSFYKYCNNSPLLAKALKMQLVNRGLAVCEDGLVKFVVKGRRMSGDFNTSLGNIIIMVLMLLRMVGVSRLHKYELGCDGDDSFIIVERRDLDRILPVIPTEAGKLGFEIKVEDVCSEFERIDFCQTSPIWTPLGWVACRNPRKVLAKDAFSMKTLNNQQEYDSWRNSVSVGGRAAFANMPILSSYFLHIGRGAKYDHVCFDKSYRDLQAGDYVAPSFIDDRTRSSFFYAFGIPPSEQRELESLFDNTNPSFYDLPAAVDNHININPIRI
jgi:hypothetical protein